MREDAWQICPKCDGGRIIKLPYPCSVCRGEEIISTLTGKPPSGIIPEAAKLAEDLPNIQR